MNDYTRIGTWNGTPPVGATGSTRIGTWNGVSPQGASSAVADQITRPAEWRSLMSPARDVNLPRLSSANLVLGGLAAAMLGSVVLAGGMLHSFNTD